MLIEADTGLRGRFAASKYLDRGSDGSSKIYSAVEVASDCRVAVKVVDLEERLKEAEYEVTTLTSLRHPNIIALHAAFVFDKYAFFVLPLYSSCSLHCLLESDYKDGLPELAVSFVLMDTLKGVEYLHRCQLVHRSLKSSHLLVDCHGRVTLTGLRHCVKVERAIQCHCYPTDHAIRNLCWLSPEILAQNLQGYHLKSDVYSLGILALELANGKPPFEGLEACKVLFYKLQDVVPSLNASKCFKDSFDDFTNKCLEYDPSRRPSSHQLLRHPFIKQSKKSLSLWRFIHPSETKPLPEENSPPTKSTELNGAPALNGLHCDRLVVGEAEANQELSWSWPE